MEMNRREKHFKLYVFNFLFAFHTVCSSKLYSDQFAVEVLGGTEEAIQVAKDHGFDYLGKVSTNIYIYILRIMYASLFFTKKEYFLIKIYLQYN